MLSSESISQCGDPRLARRGSLVFNRIVATGSLVQRRVGKSRAGELGMARFLDAVFARARVDVLCRPVPDRFHRHYRRHLLAAAALSAFPLSAVAATAVAVAARRRSCPARDGSPHALQFGQLDVAADQQQGSWDRERARAGRGGCLSPQLVYQLARLR